MADRIPLFKVYMPPKDELMPALEEVLYSGQIAHGARVTEFEYAFRKFVSAPHCVAVSSCTAALHLALLLAGVGLGDEVITTALTAEPTNLAIRYARGTPVWADVEPYGVNMDPYDVRRKITPRTKAILVVHYAGIPADMSKIQEIAAEYHLPIISDAAHALGARYDLMPLPDTSMFTCYSFQAIKHMTTLGNGGMLCLPGQYEHEARNLRWFGLDRSVPRTEVSLRREGYKYDMTQVQATAGLVALPHMAECIAKANQNARDLMEGLAHVKGMRLVEYRQPECQPSFWMLPVLAENPSGLYEKLAQWDIDSGKCHARNDEHPLFRASHEYLTSLDITYPRLLHLPCGWWLTDDDKDRILRCIQGGW